jgi:basic amino acid/polyamine antiporter, APA family
MNGEANRGGHRAGLIRGLGVWSATALVIGSMIGQSVFLVASDIAREVGSAANVLAVWVAGGVVVLFGAVCYAELGAALPEAGGDYVYLKEGLGPAWGFLCGWTNAMIARPASAAVIAAGLARFAVFLWPSAATPLAVWSYHLPFVSHPYQFIFTPAQPLAAAAVFVVAALNYVGIRTVGRFQVVLTSLKIAIVAAILALGLLAKGSFQAQTAIATSPGHSLVAGFLTAVVPAMLAYNGFQFLGSVGGEVLDPGKNLPRAAIGGTAAVIVLYVLINSVYFRVLSFSQVMSSQHVASDAMTALVGAIGGRWFTIAMVISAFGTLHATLMTAPRIPYAMAQDGNFFRFARRIQPTFHTPSGALVFQAGVAILLVLSGTYQELYSYDIFATWIFLGLAAVALVRLRIVNPTLQRPFRAWGYPFTPVAFGVVALAIALNLWLLRPIRSSIGIAIILLGLPFYYRWRGRRETSLQLEQT